MLNILRQIIFYISLLLIGLLGFFISLAKPFHPNNVFYFCRIFGKFASTLMGFKVEIQNHEIFEKHKNFVVISNHQDNMDIIVCSHAVPKGCVSLGKKSIKWVPLFGQFYWLSGNILIDRSNKRKALASMNLIKEKLTNPKSNMSIWIMPEGTRSKGRGVLPFKKGAFITALNTGLPIIPVAISTFEKSIDLNKWSPGTMKMRVLDPIPTAGLTKEDLPELMEKCRNQLIENIEELDKSQS